MSKGIYTRLLSGRDVLRSSARSYIVLTLLRSSGRNSEQLQGGLANERPKNIAWKGTNTKTHKVRRTLKLRLLDRIGPLGRFSEKEDMEKGEDKSLR